MAQDSKRKRYLRRVKRERTLAHRFIAKQDEQVKTLVGMLVKQRQELTDLQKPAPAFTIKTLPDNVELPSGATVTFGNPSLGDVATDPDNYYPADPEAPATLPEWQDQRFTEGYTPTDPNALTEEMNRDCCIDDSSAS